MIRIEDIKRELAHVVGWEQGLVPKDIIADELTQTESGLYFQEAHPMVTMENLRAVMPEMDVTIYPLWVETEPYKKGAIIRHADLIYRALKHNEGVEPGTDDKTWEQVDIVSLWLRSLQDGVTAKVVQTFLQVKSLLKESRPLLERMTFFDGAGRIQNTLPSGQRLVGMEIIPAYSMGVTAKIERIGLQMTGSTGTVRVYLFHSSQPDPIQVEDLEFTKTNGGFQWFTVKDWYMSFISDGNNSGGAWYLVYDQASLPEGMECVNVAKDWSREPCGTCNIGSLAAWRALTKYLSISPFRVRSSETFAEFPELWDIAENVYTNTVNYGLNVEVTVQCDLTDFIIEQRQMFATVLQREMAAKVLRMLAMNPSVRVNRNQSNASHLDLLYEVDGNPQGRKTGIGYELEKAYEALDLDTRGIDRLCMTCRPVGVRYRNV